MVIGHPLLARCIEQCLVQSKPFRKSTLAIQRWPSNSKKTWSGLAPANVGLFLTDAAKRNSNRLRSRNLFKVISTYLVLAKLSFTSFATTNQTLGCCHGFTSLTTHTANHVATSTTFVTRISNCKGQAQFRGPLFGCGTLRRGQPFQRRVASNSCSSGGSPSVLPAPASLSWCRRVGPPRPAMLEERTPSGRWHASVRKNLLLQCQSASQPKH